MKNQFDHPDNLQFSEQDNKINETAIKNEINMKALIEKFGNAPTGKAYF